MEVINLSSGQSTTYGENYDLHIWNCQTQSRHLWDFPQIRCSDIPLQITFQRNSFCKAGLYIKWQKTFWFLFASSVDSPASLRTAGSNCNAIAPFSSAKKQKKSLSVGECSRFLYLMQVGNVKGGCLPLTVAHGFCISAAVPWRILNFDNPFLALSD